MPSDNRGYEGRPMHDTRKASVELFRGELNILLTLVREKFTAEGLPDTERQKLMTLGAKLSEATRGL